MSDQITYIVNGRRVDPNGVPVAEPKAAKPKASTGKAAETEKPEGKATAGDA